MKKTILASLMLAAVALLAGACGSSSNDDDDDDIIWDFAPIVFQIQMENAAGQDMLDPQNNDNLLGRLSAGYKGQTYRPQMEDAYYQTPTRYYAAFLNGLLLRQWYDQERQRKSYYLEFGEFDGAKDGEEEVTLSLAPMVDTDDAVTQTFRLSYTNQLTWKSKREPVVSRRFFLDGAAHGGPTYRFVYDAASQRLSPKD